MRVVVYNRDRYSRVELSVLLEQEDAAARILKIYRDRYMDRTGVERGEVEDITSFC